MLAIQWMQLWLFMSVGHVVHHTGRALLRPEGLSTETWRGLIPGMCWCIECRALWRLCVIKATGVVLFNLPVPYHIFSLILQWENEGVSYFMPGVRQHEVLKEKMTHIKSAFLLRVFLGWLKDKEMKVAWKTGWIKSYFWIILHTMTHLLPRKNK